MAEASSSKRLMSLDAFRGATIALMILVNNPGSWGHIYWPLDHAEWDGWTPTDFVFPFFLFIVGVAMTFSFDKRLHAGQDRLRLYAHVFRRGLTIILLGLTLMSFPNMRLAARFILPIIGMAYLYADEPVFSLGRTAKERIHKYLGIAIIAAGVGWFVIDFAHFQGAVRPPHISQLFPLTNSLEGGTVLRIPGVLQRIGLAFLIASAIMFVTRTRGRIAWTVGILVGYYLIMKFVHPPAGYEFAKTNIDPPADAPFKGLLNDWIDVHVFGARHLYSHSPDPEGLLSTLPAVATVLLGIITGSLLHAEKSEEKKTFDMIKLGVVLLAVGYAASFLFPINKKLWSSSYVPFMAGWSLLFLAAAYYVIDVLGFKKWAIPLVVFGTNAIFVFFLSGLLGRVMGIVKIGDTSVKGLLYSNLYTSWIDDPKLASFAWAISYILFWLVVTYPLYRKRIFIKV